MGIQISSRDAALLKFWALSFRQVVSDIRRLVREFEELRGLLKGDGAKRQRLLKLAGSDGWWPVYEMSEKAALAYGIFQSGLAMELAKRLAKGGVRALLTSALDGSLNSVDVEPRNPQAAIRATWPFWYTIQSILLFGATMHELISRADVSDDAMLNAIKVDPTAINCAACQRRIVRAALEHDEQFMRRVGSALSRQKKIQSRQFPDLDVCLYILMRAGQLDWVCQEELAYRLFCVELAELRLYPIRGGGSGAALLRHIQRRRNSWRATRKLQSLS